MSNETRFRWRQIGQSLTDGQQVIGHRYVSVLNGDQLSIISVNGVNQPTFRSFHETPMLGGAVATFDLGEKQWQKDVPTFRTISGLENLEARLFSFRRTNFLLTYVGCNQFSYERLYYWQSDDKTAYHHQHHHQQQQPQPQQQWRACNLYVDEKCKMNSVDKVSLTLAVNPETVYLLAHDSQHGLLSVSHLDTVCGYGNPGPARICHQTAVELDCLRGNCCRVLAAVVHERQIFVVLQLAVDPADPTADANAGDRSQVKLLTVGVSDGRTSLVNLADSPMGAPSSRLLTDSLRCCSRRCMAASAPDSKLSRFCDVVFSWQWLLIVDDLRTDSAELWSIDLRENRFRPLLSLSSSAGFPGSLTSQVQLLSANDVEFHLYGIDPSFAVYEFDAKSILEHLSLFQT